MNLEDILLSTMCASSNPPCSHHTVEAAQLADQIRTHLLSETVVKHAAHATHPDDIAYAEDVARTALTAALDPTEEPR